MRDAVRLASIAWPAPSIALAVLPALAALRLRLFAIALPAP